MKKSEYEQVKELGFKALDRVDNALNFADAKVGFLFAFVSLLVGLMIDHFATIQAIFSSGAAVHAWILGISIGGMAVGIVAIIVASIFVVFPRLNVATKPSYLFFGTIHAIEVDELIKQFSALETYEAIEHILAQLHAVSIIAHKKFASVKIAMIGAIGVFIAWLIIMVEVLLVG